MKEKKVNKELYKLIRYLKIYRLLDFYDINEGIESMRNFNYHLTLFEKHYYELYDYFYDHQLENEAKAVKKLRELASDIQDRLDKLYNIISPYLNRNIDHSWDSVDWIDVAEIGLEAEKYTDPSNVDKMTLEEALKLIEEHNPSFAKAKREELAAQNSELSQPATDSTDNEQL